MLIGISYSHAHTHSGRASKWWNASNTPRMFVNWCRQGPGTLRSAPQPHTGHRGDKPKAQRLEQWLLRVTSVYADRILPLDEETAHVWGRLRVPNPQNPLDKQMAATAPIHDLVIVSRNVAHYAPTGVRVRNPFA